MKMGKILDDLEYAQKLRDEERELLKGGVEDGD
jgi:hypothetical protein